MTDKEFVLSRYPNAVHIRWAASADFCSPVFQRIRVSWSPRRYLCKCRRPENVWRAARQKIEHQEKKAKILFDSHVATVKPE